MSAKETALKAVLAKLQEIPGPVFERNTATAERIPDGGRGVLLDGDAGDPERTIGQNPTWTFERIAELHVMVQDDDQVARDALMDSILVAVGAKLHEDQTLDCDADWVEVMTDEDPEEVQEDGTEAEKHLIVLIMVRYTADNPLG